MYILKSDKQPTKAELAPFLGHTLIAECLTAVDKTLVNGHIALEEVTGAVSGLRVFLMNPDVRKMYDMDESFAHDQFGLRIKLNIEQDIPKGEEDNIYDPSIYLGKLDQKPPAPHKQPKRSQSLRDKANKDASAVVAGAQPKPPKPPRKKPTVVQRPPKPPKPPIVKHPNPLQPPVVNAHVVPNPVKNEPQKQRVIAGGWRRGAGMMRGRGGKVVHRGRGKPLTPLDGLGSKVPVPKPVKPTDPKNPVPKVPPQKKKPVKKVKLNFKQPNFPPAPKFRLIKGHGLIPIPNPPINQYGDGVTHRPGGYGAGGKPIGTVTDNGACPSGFYELSLMRQHMEANLPGPLFKYGSVYDILKEFDINRKIFVRIYKNLVEVVVLKGVKEPELKVVAWILNHLIGTFFVNTPTPQDTAALKHIKNVTKETKSVEILKCMMKYLDDRFYPIHFVLATKHNMLGQPINAMVNSMTIGRLYKAYHNEGKRYDHMIL